MSESLYTPYIRPDACMSTSCEHNNAIADIVWRDLWHFYLEKNEQRKKNVEHILWFFAR